MKKHDAGRLGLHKNKLPHSIIEVIATLQKAGFEAYIVGGGVRDSLLGLSPKDFDAVTNARPHQIKDVFGSRCRIIGKRFLLAHVYSGREMIEVATFRATPTDEHHKSDDGMIMRDNVWGNINDDFERRDFTINALYYDPIKGEILDFCQALKDIKHKKIKLLGKPKLRIKEDPVRLLRALRFQAKLGFDFDKTLAKEFNSNNWQLLDQISAHRLYDETQKMFTGGYLSTLLPLLYEYGAINALFTNASNTPTNLMMSVAKTSDMRIQNGRSANPAYFYAVLLWENYLQHLHQFHKKMPFYDAQLKSASRTIDRQRQKTAIPRFAEEFISQIWFMQPKLINIKPAEVASIINHPSFRASYDFLVAQEAVGVSSLAEPTNNMGKWWTEFLLFDDKARQTMLDTLATPNRRRRTNRQNPHATNELLQLKKLTLDDKQSVKPTKTAKPLFENKHSQTKAVMPIFEKIVYTDSDFEKLLGDEPFIPFQRRHRQSIQSRFALKTPTKRQPKKPKSANTNTAPNQNIKAKPPKPPPKTSKTDKPLTVKVARRPKKITKHDE